MKWWVLHNISVNCVWLYLFDVFTVKSLGSCGGMELRNLTQIKCTKHTEGTEGTSQQECHNNNKHKVHIGEFNNKDWSCSIRQQSKYRYSKQSLLGIANIVNSHSTYKQMDTGSIRKIRRLRLNQRGK